MWGFLPAIGKSTGIAGFLKKKRHLSLVPAGGFGGGVSSLLKRERWMELGPGAASKSSLPASGIQHEFGAF